jgi:hypothetical protein
MHQDGRLGGASRATPDQSLSERFYRKWRGKQTRFLGLGTVDIMQLCSLCILGLRMTISSAGMMIVVQ